VWSVAFALAVAMFTLSDFSCCQAHIFASAGPEDERLEILTIVSICRR